MSNKIRVWAAVKAPDGTIQCVVEDHDSVPYGKDWQSQSDYRIWMMVCWSPDSLDVLIDEQRSCTKGAVCAPGKPCVACHGVAQRVWVDWTRKAAVRVWRASCEPDGHNGYATRHWCPHDHRKRHTAIACAAKLKMPKVVEKDGHGKTVP